MAYYEAITIEEMDEVLRAARFYPVSLMYRNRPVKEWVYERKLPRSSNHFVRVYTGINRYGREAGNSRKVGKDAIRVQVVYRDLKGETLVSQPKRVHRVAGWRKNLKNRFDELATKLPQVEFDNRGEPMTLRKKNKSYFWGSRDYPKYKETKPFRAEFALEEEFCDEHFHVTWDDLAESINRIINRKLPSDGEVFRTKEDIPRRWYNPYNPIPRWGSDAEHGTSQINLATMNMRAIYQHYVDRFCAEYQGESPLAREELLDNITASLSRPLYFVLDIDWLTFQQYDSEGDVQDNAGVIREAQILVITNGFSLEWVLQTGIISDIGMIFETESDEYGRSWAWEDFGTMNWIYLGEGREVTAPYISGEDPDSYGVYPIEFYERILPYTNDNYFDRPVDSPIIEWETLFKTDDGLGRNQYDATFLPFQFLITEQIGGDNWITTEDDDVGGLVEQGFEVVDGVRYDGRGDYTYDTAFQQTFFNAEDEPNWDDIDWDEEWETPEPEWEDIGWDAEEITLKEFDDTGVGKDQLFSTIDDKIAFQFRNYNKTNRYGDIGCPVCNSIGLFGSEIITKGRKWFCWDCGYEEKIESIKSRGDITLEKYGLLIECPVCERPVKAYNNDTMKRHIKKCKEGK